MEERKSPMNVQEQKGETGVVDWKNRTAKKDICMDCGKEFIITLGEFVDKLQHGIPSPWPWTARPSSTPA